MGAWCFFSLSLCKTNTAFNFTHSAYLILMLLSCASYFARSTFLSWLLVEFLHLKFCDCIQIFGVLILHVVSNDRFSSFAVIVNAGIFKNSINLFLRATFKWCILWNFPEMSINPQKKKLIYAFRWRLLGSFGQSIRYEASYKHSVEDSLQWSVLSANPSGVLYDSTLVNNRVNNSNRQSKLIDRSIRKQKEIHYIIHSLSSS